MSSDAESIRCWIRFEGFCFLLFVRLFTNYVYIKKVLADSETMDFFSWLLVCGCFWFNYITKQPTLCKSLVSDHLQSCTPRSCSLLLYPGHLKKGPVCLEKQELTYSSETGCKTFSLLCLGEWPMSLPTEISQESLCSAPALQNHWGSPKQPQLLWFTQIPGLSHLSGSGHFCWGFHHFPPRPGRMDLSRPIWRLGSMGNTPFWVFLSLTLKVHGEGRNHSSGVHAAVSPPSKLCGCDTVVMVSLPHNFKVLYIRSTNLLFRFFISSRGLLSPNNNRRGRCFWEPCCPWVSVKVIPFHPKLLGICPLWWLSFALFAQLYLL